MNSNNSIKLGVDTGKKFGLRKNLYSEIKFTKKTNLVQQVFPLLIIVCKLKF